MKPGPYSESQDPADELTALRNDLHQARAQRGAAERQAAANYAKADDLARAITAYLDARDEARPLEEAGARRRLDALLGRAPRREGSARAVRLIHEMSAARRMGLGGGFGTQGEG